MMEGLTGQATWLPAEAQIRLVQDLPLLSARFLLPGAERSIAAAKIHFLFFPFVILYTLS